ncbi:pyridoxal-phosphate dependent enzyme [Actinomycetes bacterium KLBMP 9797]
MSGGLDLAPLRCPRCGHTGDPRDLTTYQGCPGCAPDVPVNYVCDVPPGRVAAALRPAADRPRGHRGLWRWAGALPVDAVHAVSLGEGDTPLLPLPRLGARFGAPRLAVKNESANPTWSHKDRLCALAVAAARALGATTVTAASTGNHGASLAAYAARAGLHCVIFTLASVPATMKTLMLSYGADVVAVPTSEHRYVLMAEGVRRHGWYPASNGSGRPVGSTPYGIDGYKTIAYELFEQLGGRVPDAVVLPVTYGDCLSGVHRGFADLRAAGLVDRVPRLVAAELFGALAQALTGRGLPPVPTRETVAFSISTPRATHQAVEAIRATGGIAVPVTEEELLEAGYLLATNEGLFVEASSAVGVAAVGTLVRAGRIRPDDEVVCVLTSSGLKDPDAGRALLPDVPVIDLDQAAPAEVVAQLDQR